jgi:hypothetical protein
MRKQFDELVETMKRWDLYQENDEVDCALNDLESAIDEVEKRMICAVRSAKEINKSISKYTARVDKQESFVMTVNSHDEIQNSSDDVRIALDLNEDMCIKDNWYNLFSPKEEPIEEFASFESSWGIITCAKDGVVISVDGDLEIDGELNYLFDIAKFDLDEYGKFCESRNITMGEADDILAVGFWRKDNIYNAPDYEWRNSIFGVYDVELLKGRFEAYTDEELQLFNGDNEETLKNWNREDAIQEAIDSLIQEKADEVAPTELSDKTKKNEIVNNIISQLKDINVDGETMSRIVSELGFDEYLMKSLMMSRSNLEIIDNLAEKEKINGY